MTTKLELYQIIRQLRQHLAWENQYLAIGGLPASPAQKQRWQQIKDALDRRAHQRAREQLFQDSQSHATQQNNIAQPSDRQSPAQPNSTPSSEEKPALWTQFGNMSRRTFTTPPATKAPKKNRAPTSPTNKSAKTMTAAEKLAFLRNYMGDCRRCGLCQTRQNIVFGDGHAQARIMFVGEAPGFYEDQKGIPFVGKAGELLTKMISAMGFERKEVYITNILKCRPPENRNPAADEIRECSPFLLKQIAAVQPQVIVTLGLFATQTLLQTDKPMKLLRGQWQSMQNIAVMPTYHPAYLLRNTSAKADAWSDLKQVMKKLAASDMI